MRVALVASLVSPLRLAEANGPHGVMLDVARGLTERGHEVAIYAAAGSEADGIRIVQIPVDGAAQSAAIKVGVRPSPMATATCRR